MAQGSITSRDRRRSWGPNNYLNRFNYGSNSQTISITDLISEGPIEGLVRAGKSIFLNSDPIFEDEETTYASTAGETISGTANNQTITINDFDQRSFTYNPTEEENASRLLYIHYLLNLLFYFAFLIALLKPFLHYDNAIFLHLYQNDDLHLQNL